MIDEVACDSARTAVLTLWPPPEPVPVEGCARCGELAALRGRARAGGDLSGVSDCNVLLRRHQEGHR
ncbi:hypothetical protein [Streptomyces sp. enrichment culture]|uniref:hypothetical protein n=1 Tax=Streptomyces sp. enrichment culture TaxID=1795815 RepID=UPI003F56B52D